MVCEHCLRVTSIPKHRFSDRRACSLSCSAELHKNRVLEQCSQCHASFERRKGQTSKTGLYFCTRKCKDAAQRLEGISALHPPHYGTGKYNREYLLRVRGHQCEHCKSTEWQGLPIPLEVHHIDGDAFNECDANHQLLCRNCHAQTPNFKHKNHGYGRKSRSSLQSGEPAGAEPTLARLV